jgi:thiamine-monophosphate kinase
MKLSEIGEFGFIDRFSKHFHDMVEPGTIKGIGDDCAIMPLNDQYDQVVTTDLLIEDIHFLRSSISPLDLGYKALAINLSDIAAMGARPTASFLSIALPIDIDVEYMDKVMEGYHQLSRKYHVPLLGGDTTRSPEKLIINVCATGQISKGEAHLRSDARPGDVICVTGPLGDSAAGLKMLVEDITPDQRSSSLIAWHHRPEPAINEGLWLSKQPGVRAMMDISDGIASDLKHILKMSNTGAIINIEDVPVSDALKKTAAKYDWNIPLLTLAGGEDYRLLVTIERSAFNSISEEYSQLFSFPLTSIGLITDTEQGNIKWYKNNTVYHLSKGGFTHF